MLVLEGVSVAYDGTCAVNGVDLTVGDGEIVCVLGPSGSGKSTLLRAIAGLEPLTGGRIVRDGTDLAGTPPHKRNLGLMFQDHALFPHRDVLGNVAFGLRARDVPRADALARAREVLALVGLAGFDQRAVHELSGGEQQRVALARALAPAPGLLMLDEPLGSLDRALRDRLVVELRELLAALGQSALFVTHDHDEALAVADRVAIMRAGRVEQVGAPLEVWRRPATEFVARFLGWNVTGLLGEGPAASASARAGIRPDGLGVVAEGELAGVVTARTFRRDHFLVRVRVDSEELDVAVRGDAVPAVGDAVRLAVDPAAVVRFET